MAFTVDRARRLSPGMVLDRVRHTDMDPPALQPHVDALFPAGVTQHGNRYFLGAGSSAQAVSPNVELVFEYVRRAEFSHAPSRFESVFGSETIEAAEAFNAVPTWGSPGAPIYEVETPHEPFRADMACLARPGSILVTSYAAHRYWSGLPNGFDELGRAVAPVWEVLLTPPVTVIRKIT